MSPQQYDAEIAALQPDETGGRYSGRFTGSNSTPEGEQILWSLTSPRHSALPATNRLISFLKAG
jgi:hypothetical protein